jgi:hypothetical protein
MELFEGRVKRVERKQKVPPTYYEWVYEFVVLMSNDADIRHDTMEVIEAAKSYWDARKWNFFHCKPEDKERKNKFYVGTHAGHEKLLSDTMNILGALKLISRFGLDIDITIPIYDMALQRVDFYKTFYLTEKRYPDSLTEEIHFSE